MMSAMAPNGQSLHQGMQTQQNLRNQINKSIMSSGTTSGCGVNMSGGGLPPRKKSATRKMGTKSSQLKSQDTTKFKQSN